MDYFLKLQVGFYSPDIMELHADIVFNPSDKVENTVSVETKQI